MESPMWLADHSPKSGHNSRRHERAKAASAPYLGRPVLIFVVDGVGSIRAKKLDHSVDDYSLAFFSGSSRPLQRVVSFEKTCQNAGFTLQRGYIADRARWRQITPCHPVQPTLAPEGAFIRNQVLNDGTHWHVLGEQITFGRQRRVVGNAHGEGERNRYDSVISPPNPFVAVDRDPVHILRHSSNWTLQNDFGLQFTGHAHCNLVHALVDKERLRPTFV